MCRNNNHTKLYAWRLNSQSQHPTDTYIHIHTYTHHVIISWPSYYKVLMMQTGLIKCTTPSCFSRTKSNSIYEHIEGCIYICNRLYTQSNAVPFNRIKRWVCHYFEPSTFLQAESRRRLRRETIAHKWHSLLNYSTLSVNRTRARTPCFRRRSQSWISTFKERLAWRCPFILYTRVRSRQVRCVWCVTPRWMRPSSPLPGVCLAATI